MTSSPRQQKSFLCRLCLHSPLQLLAPLKTKPKCLVKVNIHSQNWIKRLSFLRLKSILMTGVQQSEETRACQEVCLISRYMGPYSVMPRPSSSPQFLNHKAIKPLPGQNNKRFIYSSSSVTCRPERVWSCSTLECPYFYRSGKKSGSCGFFGTEQGGRDTITSP